MAKITIFEYGLMANDVYLDVQQAMLPTLTAYGWERLFDNTGDTHRAGFFARIYYNPVFEHYVIAFRGTKLSSPGTLLADAQYAVGKKPKMYIKAEIFYAEFLTNLGGVDNPHAKISLTGHSLGGILAKLLGAETGLRAVAFNAPGIAKTLRELRTGDHPNIININSEKGLINKVGTRVGREYVLNLKHGELLCKTAKIIPIPLMKLECIVEKHQMAHLLDAVKYHPELSDMRY